MRGLLLTVLALLLLPAAVAAQRTPPDLGAIKSAPLARIAESQAVTTAVSKVRSDLVSEQLITWGGGTGGGIRPSTVAAAGALFNPTGGRAGVYVVPVTAANAKGHVRVVIDGASGQVLSTRLSSWDWGAAPAWWRQGLDASPAR